MSACRRFWFVLWVGALLVAVFSLGGCSGSDGSQSGDAVPGAASRAESSQSSAETSARAGGAVGCGRRLVTYHDGSRPARRPVVVPPAPQVLRAVAVTEHMTRVDWAFPKLPAACRPVAIAVSVRSGAHPPAVKVVPVRAASGSARIAYTELLPAPDEVSAFAYGSLGQISRSSTVSVQIERGADVPPDPPKPVPPRTAPAGRPIACSSRATTVADPVGDVLTFRPGLSPRQVVRVRPGLAGIDITRATVQIDERRVCARFTFAGRLPRANMQVRLSVRDVSNPYCCASLRFRRTQRGFEVGRDVLASGGTELRPVRGAGAALSGRTLVITGTLPPRREWPKVGRRIPVAGDIGWSVTSGYFPQRYGPYFGDWLPRYEAASQAMIRHADGAVVQPGGPQRR